MSWVKILCFTHPSTPTSSLHKPCRFLYRRRDFDHFSHLVGCWIGDTKTLKKINKFVFQVFILPWLLLVLVQFRPGPRNKWPLAKDHGKDLLIILYAPSNPWLCLAGLLWCFSTGSPDADRHQSLVGAWWSGLSQKEESCSHPDKVTLASCHYPLNRQREKHSYPAAISARQRPITTRQRANSKRTWMKPDGSEWSYIAKVSVIISNKLKL